MQSSSIFQIGDRVIVTKTDMLNEAGTIQFIGSLDGKEGIYHGLALDV